MLLLVQTIFFSSHSTSKAASRFTQTFLLVLRLSFSQAGHSDFTSKSKISGIAQKTYCPSFANITPSVYGSILRHHGQS